MEHHLFFYLTVLQTNQNLLEPPPPPTKNKKKNKKKQHWIVQFILRGVFLYLRVVVSIPILHTSIPSSTLTRISLAHTLSIFPISKSLVVSSPTKSLKSQPLSASISLSMTDSSWNQIRLNPSLEIHATLTLLFSSVSPSLILKLHTFHYNPDKYSAKFEGIWLTNDHMRE